jgi:hypothetical protein
MNEHRGEEASPAGGRPANEAKASAAPGDWSNLANWTAPPGVGRKLPWSGTVGVFHAPKDPPENKQR